jgi:excisionase family DNA binding protein
MLALRSQLDSKSTPENPQRLLTVKEAAQYLSISVSTLYGWVWQRRVPFVKIGRAVRFDPRDVEAFVEANKQRSRQTISQSGSRANPCYNMRAAGKG